MAKTSTRVKRTVFRVQRVRRGFRGWDVTTKRDGRAEVLTTYYSQANAIRWAVVAARDARPSQVVLHGLNGRIRWERTYGADPKRSPG